MRLKAQLLGRSMVPKKSLSIVFRGGGGINGACEEQDRLLQKLDIFLSPLQSPLGRIHSTTKDVQKWMKQSFPNYRCGHVEAGAFFSDTFSSPSSCYWEGYIYQAGRLDGWMMARGQSSMLAVRQLTSGLLLLPSLKEWKYLISAACPRWSTLLLHGFSQQTHLNAKRPECAKGPCDNSRQG